jgi:hypothetical protein
MALPSLEPRFTVAGERLRGSASYESDEPDWNFSPRQPNTIRDKREVPRVSSMGDLPWVGATKILNAK